MSIQSLHAQSFSRLFYQRSFEDISRHVEDFLDESLIAMLYQPVIERLQSAQQKGDSILILSSSPDFLVKAIAHRLGVQEWQATLYQVDEGGKFQTIAYVMGGEEKAKYVREFVCCKGLSLANTTIYSDSYLDLPVLNIAGRPVGVVPDKSLKEVCLQKGWEIL